MALCNRLCLLRGLKVAKFRFSTSSSSANWRTEQGLEKDPREFSPLTRRQDFSFVDGRPVPLSGNQLKKLKEQENFCKKIVELSHELDVGLELYHEKMRQKAIEKETIIKNKLKAKGAALLTKVKDNSKK